jgi:hypothetical protein
MATQRMFVAILAGALCLAGPGQSPAAGDQAVSHTALWDTSSVADGGTVDLAARKNWRRVSPDAAARALQGDLVVENERIAVVFCRRAAGPLLCPKSAAPAEGKDASRLVAVAANGQPATSLTGIEVRKHDEDEVVLEVAARTQDGQALRTAYTLATGRVFVECKPLQNTARIAVEAATRFAVIPDFFGADMVFDPRAYPQPRLVIPPENFVLNLLEGGNTIVMSVWPAGNQEAELVLAGAGEDRRIQATRITCDSKSVYVAALNAPAIWHERRLQEPYADTDVALGWKKPFQAKWRANFCRQRRSDSWDFQDRRDNTWMYLYGPIIWPCWFDGESGFVRLSRKFLDVKGPMDLVLVYPSDRKKDTPLTAITPVDVVRETLGVGPCEYVLDREGLQGRSANKGRKNFGRGVCDTTTPIEYFFITGMETRESALVGHLVDDILADIRAINARVLEFRRFGEELGKWCLERRRQDAAAGELLNQAAKCAKEIESLYKEKLPIIKDPVHAAEVGQRIKDLAARTDPENLGECKTLTYDLRDVAGTQHRMVGDYRVMVKRLRQEVAVLGAQDPATTKTAEGIRKLAAQVLRNKYSVEAE